MDVNESFILKCGFESESYDLGEKEYIINKSPIRILDVLGDCYFYLFLDDYHTDLCGFIEKHIYIYKCKLANGRYGWVLRINNEFSEIKTSLDILGISNDVSYNSKLGFTYIIKSKLGYKIGYSKSIHNRSKIFNVKLPFDWKFECIFTLTRYKDMEKMLHELYDHKWINGEWFDLKAKDISVAFDLYQCLRCPA